MFSIVYESKKLSTAYLYPIIIVIFILPMLLTFYDASHNKSHLLKELNSTADQLLNISAAAAEDAFWSYNEISLEQIADAISEYKDVAAVNILDEDDHVVYGVNKKGNEYRTDYLLPVFNREVLKEDIKIGEIRIIYTSYYMDKEVNTEIFLGFTRTIAISIITLFIIYLLTRNITLSIDNIDSGVKAFSEGNRDSRIYVKDNHEIRRLAERINKMFQTIVETDIMLQKNFLMLKNNEEALRISEERYRYAVEGSNDAIWDWNLASNDFYISARGAQMAGLVENEDLDLPTWISIIHPQDKNQFENYLEEFKQNPDSYRQIQFRIVDNNGDIRWLFCRGKGILNQSRQLLRISGFYTDITERIKAEERIHHLAYYDVLTGLPNRAMLFEQVNQKFLEHQHPLQSGALIFMDLDDFKAINDTKGHTVGDQVLVQLAKELEAGISHDLIARIGGDEFVIIFKDCSIDQVYNFASQIENLVRMPRIVNGYEFVLSCSIGIVIFPEDGNEIETLLMKADSAMYQAKLEGKNQYKFYDQSINDKMVQKIKMQNEIRQGIINREFVLYYQPQIDLTTGKIIGVEALVRWQHPINGLLMPLDFIGLSEETGLIIPLGEYILRTACEQSITWEKAGIKDIKMSVNISAKQLNMKNIVQDILSIVDELDMKPENLMLEITESASMENVEHTIAVMNSLRVKGITFSLDDFGTGYSSLNYLKNIPINHLKIDKQFVQSMSKQTYEDVVVRSIIDIAHSMDLIVVAEGIETPEQKETLTSYNCDLAQGYYYSRPIPKQEVEELLRQDISYK